MIVRVFNLIYRERYIFVLFGLLRIKRPNKSILQLIIVQIIWNIIALAVHNAFNINTNEGIASVEMAKPQKLALIRNSK